MSRFKAVVFDWAGTMIDFGSFAPVAAFVEAFARLDIHASLEQARQPMGLPKREHIRAMLTMPTLAAQWQTRFAVLPGEAAIDRVYDIFVPLNEQVVADHAELVPGALPMLGWLAQRGIKVGSTTGYTRSIMAQLLPLAAAQGYTPLNVVCADDLPEGRPGPLGMYRCLVDLVVHPAAVVIKVDDTEPGIAEGVAAGCVTVGVTLSGNHAALTPEMLAALPDDERDAIRQRAGIALRTAGADHVIDTVADLPRLIERLEQE